MLFALGVKSLFVTSVHVFLGVTGIAVKSYLHSATQKNESTIHRRIIFILIKLVCSFLITKILFNPHKRLYLIFLCISSFRFLRLQGPLHNFGLLWKWFKLKPSVLKGWNELIDTPVHIWWTKTSTGKWSWTPILKCRSSVTPSRSVGQAEILPLPTIIGETVILHLECKERVQNRLTWHLLSQVLKVELLVRIVGIVRQHLKAGGKITISRFNQEGAFLGVIFGPEGVVTVEFGWLLVHAREYRLVSDSKLVKHRHCNRYWKFKFYFLFNQCERKKLL